MGNPENDYAVWAYLDQNNVVNLCSREKANEWWHGEEGKRCHIKYDRIDGWGIETRFYRFSRAMDGPPLFFRVVWFRWIEAIHTMKIGKRYFGTMEAALKFHAGLMDTLKEDGGAKELLELTNPVADWRIDEDELSKPGADWRIDDDTEVRDAADWWKE